MENIVEQIVALSLNKKIIMLGDVHGEERVLDLFSRIYPLLINKNHIQSCSFELSIDCQQYINDFIMHGSREIWNQIYNYDAPNIVNLKESWFLFWEKLRSVILEKNITIKCVDVGIEDQSRIWKITPEERAIMSPLEAGKYADNSERCKIIAERILSMDLPVLHIGGPGHLERKEQYIKIIDQNIRYDRYWLEQKIEPDSIISFVCKVENEKIGQPSLIERENNIFDIIF